MVVSPLCAFYSSQLQQKLPYCQVHALVSQLNLLRLLKIQGTLSHYPYTAVSDTINIVTLADPSHGKSGSQLCNLIGLVNGDGCQVVDHSPALIGVAQIQTTC